MPAQRWGLGDFRIVVTPPLSSRLPFTARSSANTTDARDLMKAGPAGLETAHLLLANREHLGVVDCRAGRAVSQAVLVSRRSRTRCFLDLSKHRPAVVGESDGPVVCSGVAPPAAKQRRRSP